MSNGIDRFQDFYPNHPVPGRLHTEPNTFSKQAGDRVNPIGFICASVVFNLLSSATLTKPTDTWDTHPPAEWSLELKKALLSTELEEGTLTATRKLLTNSLLTTLLHSGYEHVKDVMSRCDNQAARAYVARKNNFQASHVIRANLERNPLLTVSFAFVDDLYFLNRLAGQPATYTRLSYSARFAQKLCKYIKNPARILTTPGDHCFLYICQFADSCIDVQESGTFKQQLFQKCQDADALDLINRVIDDGIEELDESILSQFLLRLYQVSTCFGDEVWIQALCYFKIAVEEIQEDRRDHESVLVSHSLWESSSTLPYGVLPLFERSTLIEAAFKQLDTLPLHTAKSNAVQQLAAHFFDECAPTSSLAAATWLYKIWWLHHRREERIQSHVDALIDWFAHDFLVEDGGWKFSEQSAVHEIKKRFRAGCPLLPFNAQQAERMYFALQYSQAQKVSSS
ncbi:MAG: hypothetical protein S4CHLAM2_02800 [Chlamydiales bacterium]|nr:hypothetical protein [Chlamydiales bacterium]